MRERERAVAGPFLLATLTALGLWAVGLLVHTVMTEGPGTAARLLPYLLIGGVLVGLPLIAAVITGIAVPALLVLRRTRLLTLPLALALGAACGLVTREAVRRLWGAPESEFVPFTVVLFTGSATAAVWWRAWRRGAPRERVRP